MKLFKSSFAALVIGLLFTATVFAQNQTVTGVVSDSNNVPMVGAAVMVKGTSKGAVTDIDGKYTLQVGPDAVLICQSIGYKTQEEPVSGRSVINFTLADDAEVLEATVVVGYGTLKKTQLVGAVETVDGEALENRTNATVSRSLQGQVAGLQIVTVDGKASHQGAISIRGNSSKSYESRTATSGKEFGTY